MPAPPAPVDDPLRPVNINYVYGFSSMEPQDWLPQPLYVALMLVILPTAIFLPTHLLLSRLFTVAGLDGRRTGQGASQVPLRPEYPNGGS